MKTRLPRLMSAVDDTRRRLLAGLALSGGIVALGAGGRVRGQEAEDGDDEEDDDMRFPGDEPDHKIVYQFNHSEEEYQHHVLGSAGAMLRTYQDNIGIVVTCFGRGIHILAKRPTRPVSDEIKARVRSLNDYGVRFHACGRTLNSLKWTKDDIVDFAQIVPVGAADLMELQEKGYAYLAW